MSFFVCWAGYTVNMKSHNLIRTGILLVVLVALSFLFRPADLPNVSMSVFGSETERARVTEIIEDGEICEFGERVTLASNPDSRFYQLLETGLEEVLA